jgi:cell division protein FtsI (penicillin-binding protein 3)
LVPNAEDWGESTVMTAAFGQGIAVNAVQLAGAVATIVNDGVPVHPTLLKQASALSEGPKEHVISPRTSAVLRGLMRLVVTRGTAKGNDVSGYLIGGKTGTADKIVDGRYSTHARLSSFIGVFPIDAPRYLVFAMLDDPKAPDTHDFATGGKVAAPVVSKVIARIGPLLDVTPRDEDQAEAAERRMLKPLRGQMVDGLPVDVGSNYASNETDRDE